MLYIVRKMPDSNFGSIKCCVKQEVFMNDDEFDKKYNY